MRGETSPKRAGRRVQCDYYDIPNDVLQGRGIITAVGVSTTIMTCTSLCTVQGNVIKQWDLVREIHDELLRLRRNSHIPRLA